MPAPAVPAQQPEPRSARVQERRAFAVPDLQLREPGTPENGGDSITFEGHAAVFNVRSLPLWDWWYGEYREVVEPGFFVPALDRGPDVHLVYQHDMATAMARTTTNTLSLREDEIGLRAWARLDPADLDVQRVVPKIRNGTVDQMSFAFTVERERWEIEAEGTDEEVVTRFLVEARDIYDVAIVPQGAYSQTDAGLRAVFQRAIERGDLPEHLSPRRAGENPAGASTSIAPGGPAGGDPRLGGLRARARVARVIHRAR